MMDITVVWYDALKGIGEGKSLAGDTVFLNSTYTVSDGHFTALKAGDNILCEIKPNEKKGLYASKILKIVEERKDFNKTTFLEPRKISNDQDSSL